MEKLKFNKFQKSELNTQQFKFIRGGNDCGNETGGGFQSFYDDDYNLICSVTWDSDSIDGNGNYHYGKMECITPNTFCFPEQ